MDIFNHLGSRYVQLIIEPLFFVYIQYKNDFRVIKKTKEWLMSSLPVFLYIVVLKVC